MQRSASHLSVPQPTSSQVASALVCRGALLSSRFITRVPYSPAGLLILTRSSQMSKIDGVFWLAFVSFVLAMSSGVGARANHQEDGATSRSPSAA